MFPVSVCFGIEKPDASPKMSILSTVLASLAVACAVLTAAEDSRRDCQAKRPARLLTRKSDAKPPILQSTLCEICGSPFWFSCSFENAHASSRHFPNGLKITNAQEEISRLRLRLRSK